MSTEPNKFQILECDAVIELKHANSRTLPNEFRRCPYCGGRIAIHFEAWEKNEDGTWSAEMAKADCMTGPRGGRKLEEWTKQHTYMPYVYWLPLELALTRWVNSKFRFNVEPA